MPKPKKGPRLGGSPAHQRLILRNLATALFEHGRITTTEAKARTLRPYAEKLITKAKKAHLGENPLHQRREVLRAITDKGVVHHLFTEIAPTYAERPGGYTRITKIGPRHGDNAPMAVIELVNEAYNPKPSTPKKKAEAPKAAPAVAEEPVEETVADEAPEAVEDVAVEGTEVVEAEEAPEAEATEEVAEETAEEPVAEETTEKPAAEVEETDEQA